MVKITLGKKHGILAVVALVVVLGMGTGIAQVQDPSHSWEGITPPSGVWTGVTAENVPLSGVTDRPPILIVVGMCEDAVSDWGNMYCGPPSYPSGHEKLTEPIGTGTCTRYGECFSSDLDIQEWNMSGGWLTGHTQTLHIYYKEI